MVKRYDPDTHISEEIDTEDDRVEFLTSIAQAMATKAKIKLNTKRLYAADGRAVKELLKIAEMLYSASRANTVPEEESAEMDSNSLPSQLKNIKGARALATDITERGARLFDLLGKEVDVRVERSKALRFLDTISGSLDSTSEHQYVEKSARGLVEALKEKIEVLEKQSQELVSDEKGLDAKIKRKQAELERHEKRLKSLQSVRPAFMDEYEKLEKDLVKHYEGYLERFRNLDFLENELDAHHKSEQEKLEENDRSLKRMQKKLREDELRQLRGEMDDERRTVEPSGGPRGGARASKPPPNQRRGDVQVRGSVGGAVSESSSGDLSDDGSGSPSEGSHSQSGDVSLASSASGSGIDDDEDGSGSEISGSADFEGDDYRSEGEDSEDNF
mmetsp:Transcript_43892/g.56276  ORF Transcript_43892/g.56276 Transcript_43892/m.56276 type:complete len:388 (+) Transcript_43892:200-1363(+)